MDQLYIEFKNLGIETYDPVLFCKNSELLIKLEDISKRFLSLSVLCDEPRQTVHLNFIEVFVQSSIKFLNSLRKTEHEHEYCNSFDHLALLKTSNTLLKLVRNSFAGDVEINLHSEKFAGFFEALNHVLGGYSDDSGECDEHVNERMNLLRCCLQVAANAFSSCRSNANGALERLCHHLLEFITNEEVKDHKLKIYATAALHSGLVHAEDALFELNRYCPGFDAKMLTHQLLSMLINSGDYDDDGRVLSEWSMYVFKLLLKSSNFLEAVWELLTTQERIFTIEVLSSDCEVLAGRQLESAESLADICHQSNVDYLCLEMTNQMASFIRGHDKIEDAESCSHSLLGLLSEISSLFHLLDDPKNLTTLLTQSVDLLKILQSTSKNQKDDLSKDEKVMMSEVRRDLIKLIANLVYKNKLHQDLMRENGGLYMVMNMTVIDMICPTIQQWSLFAINNLCEDNQENRKFISDLKLDRVKDVAEDLKNAGVEVEVREGKLHFPRKDQ